MHIEQNHTLNLEEVKRRSDALAESLAALPIPDGVTIDELEHSWHGNTMDFSFHLSQGFFGTDIKGRVTASAASLALDIDVPPIVMAFIDEDNLEAAVRRKMADVLA